jgi:hypothetical protein
VGYSHQFVILNVTEGGVRDLLYLPFHIGASTVFTIGLSGGNADAAFPLRKADLTAASQVTAIVKTVAPLNHSTDRAIFELLRICHQIDRLIVVQPEFSPQTILTSIQATFTVYPVL